MFSVGLRVNGKAIGNELITAARKSFCSRFHLKKSFAIDIVDNQVRKFRHVHSRKTSSQGYKLLINKRSSLPTVTEFTKTFIETACGEFKVRNMQII